jgi:ABC-type branched-subunit amino acid transport system ATPase component/ABC-type branched-subunit amino acid transport system permease subunit
MSLGQFRVAGICAVVSIVLARDVGNFFLAFACAGLAGAATSLVIGVPALRIKGLMLTVTSLAFALAAQDWLLGLPAFLGAGREPGFPIINGYVFDTGRRYYYIALVVFLIGLWLAGNVWRGGLGRRLRAVRDNEDAARAFSVPVVKVKLQGFAFAGFLAGMGGALYVHVLSSASSSTFLMRGSTDAAAMTVLGGIGLLAGPLLGALYIIGLPQFVPLDSAEAAATSLGWLVLILFFPGGIAQAFAPLRAGLLRRLGWDPRREISLTDDAVAGTARRSGIASAGGAKERPLGPVLLEVADLRKSFGGVQALGGVSFSLRQHEILGFLGSNGAGKTTLFELVSGFLPADTGRVAFMGRDVSSLSADQRARIGLVRSFQDAALFPTLTVSDTLRLSLERAEPTRFAPAIVGLRRAERRKDEQVSAMLADFGLEAFAEARIRELSTGTRRIVDLAAIVAMRPTVLLLDEPSSGIAQRETEALAPLLLRLRDEFGLSLLVIEHDMPLLFGVADRVVAMESGLVIAEGDPASVRNDPRVLASYLGERETAIVRSDVRLPESEVASSDLDDRCIASTRGGARCARAARQDGMCHQHARAAVLV